MKVRGGDGDVTQAGHFEHMAVFLIQGDQVAPQVRVHRVAAVLEVVTQHAELLVHVAPDVDPLMTGNTTVLLEAQVTLFFVIAEDVGVAQQVLVEA